MHWVVLALLLTGCAAPTVIYEVDERKKRDTTETLCALHHEQSCRKLERTVWL